MAPLLTYIKDVTMGLSTLLNKNEFIKSQINSISN